MIQGIDVVFLHTRRSTLAKWYADTLGVDVIFDDGSWMELGLPGGTRFATDIVAGAPSAVERQPIVISFAVSDLRAEVERLVSRGITFYPSAEQAIFDVGPAWVASFRDPDGNWMQLSERKREERTDTF